MIFIPKLNIALEILEVVFTVFSKTSIVSRKYTPMSPSQMKELESHCFQKFKYKIQTSNECSILSVETLAIHKATKIIINMEHTKFLILSDSLSAINSIINKTNPCNILSCHSQNKLDEAKTNKK